MSQYETQDKRKENRRPSYTMRLRNQIQDLKQEMEQREKDLEKEKEKVKRLKSQQEDTWRKYEHACKKLGILQDHLGKEEYWRILGEAPTPPSQPPEYDPFDEDEERCLNNLKDPLYRMTFLPKLSFHSQETTGNLSVSKCK